MGLKAGGVLFAARDLERSLEFYKNVLGLEVVSDFGANVTLAGGLGEEGVARRMDVTVEYVRAQLEQEKQE